MSKMTAKEIRAKFGSLGQPIPATRVIARDMDPKHFGNKPAICLLAINDVEGTITQANVYDGNLGRGYAPENYTHPLPAEDSDKWKVYKKKGYTERQVSDFDVLTQVEVKSSKKEKAAAK